MDSASGDFIKLDVQLGKHKQLIKRVATAEKYGQSFTEVGSREYRDMQSNLISEGRTRREEGLKTLPPT